MITHENYSLGWFIKNRYYILAQTMVHDINDNSYMVAKKSCQLPKYNPEEGDNIKAMNIGCWIFQPVTTEGKEYCKYTQFVGTDLKGSIPMFLIDKVIRARTKNFYRDTLNILKKNEHISNDRPEDSSGYFETLQENGSISL